ncbi:MAG: hypothetical protein HQ526_02525 [Actinobacteria bacterium]|nr:hypothetical protein [Actinomycetota bacterium]
MSTKKSQTHPAAPRRAARPGISGATFDATQRWTRLGIGLTGLLHSFANDTYGSVTATPASAQRARNVRAKGRAQIPPAGTEQVQGVAALLPTAIAGMALTAQGWAFDKISGIEGGLQAPVARLAKLPILEGLLAHLQDFLAAQDASYRTQHAASVELAHEYLASAGPKTLDELLSRIDIDSFVDRVDVDVVISKVDIDAVIDTVSVDRVIDKIDLRAVVLETVGQVQMADVLREGTSSTARALREQVSSATRIPSRTLRRKP